jgi:hypothetical protein
LEAGRSPAAAALARARADHRVFDPELIGYLIRRLPLSPARHRDHQELASGGR